MDTLQPHTVLPIVSAAPWYFPESHWQSEISSLSKVILVLGKARSRRVPNLGYRGAESPVWFDVSPNNYAWNVIHEWACSWWSCQSSVAQSWGLLNYPNSFLRGMFKLNAKFDADSLLYSVILNVMTTQYTCSLISIYRPHWLVQWGCHYPRMHVSDSPWLSYIYILQ